MSENGDAKQRSCCRHYCYPRTAWIASSLDQALRARGTDGDKAGAFPYTVQTSNNDIGYPLSDTYNVLKRASWKRKPSFAPVVWHKKKKSCKCPFPGSKSACMCANSIARGSKPPSFCRDFRFGLLPIS